MATLGMIGLGKMGANMAERLRRADHEVVGFDISADTDRNVHTLENLVRALPAPRVVWVMVPAGEPTSSTMDALRDLLDAGDVVVDGGNSRHTDDERHACSLAYKGIGFLDAGAGHFAKMLHNGIEYGLMQAYAEGWELLQADSPAMKVVAALRNQFGGHAVTSAAGSTELGADSPGADVTVDGPIHPGSGSRRESC